MLAIGRALMSKPEMLLLDEPSLGIAPILVKAIFKQIKAIANKGVTVLLVEHDMSLVMDISDEIVVLSFGCKIAEDEPLAIQQDPEVIKIYLGEDAEEAA